MPVLVRFLLACEACLAAVYVAGYWAGQVFYQIQRLFDLNEERNVPTWFSSMQLLILGLLLLAAAGPATMWRQRRNWPVLGFGLLALALSCDEVAGIHEWLGKYSRNALPDGEYRTAFHQTGTWMLVLGPPFVAVVALIWRRFRSLLTIHPTVARRYRLGFGLYILGSLGFEYAANLVSYGTGMKIVQVVLEESAEMVAVTFLIWATIELLQIRGIRLLDTSPAPDSVEQAA